VLLDVGCGRADLLNFLHARDLDPKEYIGIEAVPQLAAAAERENPGVGRIIRADFVTDPSCLDVDADVILFSGSLNTLDTPAFYESLRAAFGAARETLAFNFLCSPLLAGQSYLHWHEPGEVAAFANKLTEHAHAISDYLQGDCTMILHKKSHRAANS
jgi:hypothetical protein